MYTRLWSTTLLCALGGSGTAWTQTFNPRAYGAKGDGGAGIVVMADLVVLENIAVINQGGVGVRIGSSHANANLWRIFNLVVVKNGSHGLYIHDPDPRIPDVNAGILLGLDARRNGGDGLRIDNATDNIFHGVMAADNAGYGINVHGTPGEKATGHIFWFPYAESNQRGGILLDTNAVFNVVFGFNALTKVDGTIDRGREDLSF